MLTIAHCFYKRYGKYSTSRVFKQQYVNWSLVFCCCITCFLLSFLFEQTLWGLLIWLLASCTSKPQDQAHAVDACELKQKSKKIHRESLWEIKHVWYWRENLWSGRNFELLTTIDDCHIFIDWVPIITNWRHLLNHKRNRRVINSFQNIFVFHIILIDSSTTFTRRIVLCLLLLQLVVGTSISPKWLTISHLDVLLYVCVCERCVAEYRLFSVAKSMMSIECSHK